MPSSLGRIKRNIRSNFKKKKAEFVPGKTRIPLSVPTYDSEEVEEALDSLLSTWVTMGSKVKRFEEMFAKYLGSRHAVMVNSGSSANLLALSVLTNPLFRDRIKPGGEIITPAVTWVTTVYPIVNVGCIPVLVDVELETFNVLPREVEKALSPNTKAIMAVHLLGGPCAIADVRRVAEKRGLFIVEDACESTGAEIRGKKVGTFGDMGTFSFYMSHHISTIEGGMIVTNNDEAYEFLKAMRAFGWTRDLRNAKQYARENPEIDPRFLFLTSGYNFRPTEIQGAFGIHQIGKLDRFIRQRRRNAAYWNRRLSPFEDVLILPREQHGTKHVYFGYPLTIRPKAAVERDRLMAHLEKRGVETRPVMAGNMAEQPVMKHIPYKAEGPLMNSRIIMRRSFFFGNHNGIGPEEKEYIGDSIVEFLASVVKR